MLSRSGPSNGSGSGRLQWAHSRLLGTNRQAAALRLPQGVSDRCIKHPPHQQPGILSRFWATEVELSRLSDDDLAHVGVIIRLRDAGVTVTLESVQHDLQAVSRC